MSVSTYLFFGGECAAAFEFYKSVFGGEYQARMTFAEGPADFKFDDDEKSKIMHVTLPIGDAVLMGSDVAKNYGEAPTNHDGFALSFLATSRADADEKFAALKEGGVATMPMQDTFWGSYYGMVRDKFGVNWMVNCNIQNEAP